MIDDDTTTDEDKAVRAVAYGWLGCAAIVAALIAIAWIRRILLCQIG